MEIVVPGKLIHVVAGAEGGGRILILVIQDKHLKSEAQLFQLRGTLQPLRAAFGFGQRRQQQRRQDPDNGNDDQQFDQGKPPRPSLNAEIATAAFGARHTSMMHHSCG